MKKRLFEKSALSLALAAILLFTPATPVAFAAGDTAAIERVVVTFHGDAQTQRGVSWFCRKRRGPMYS